MVTELHPLRLNDVDDADPSVFRHLYALRRIFSARKSQQYVRAAIFQHKQIAPCLCIFSVQRPVCRVADHVNVDPARPVFYRAAQRLVPSVNLHVNRLCTGIEIQHMGDGMGVGIKPTRAD